MDAIAGGDEDTAAELPPEAVDTGLICLVKLARFHNVAVSAEQLSHEYVSQGQPFGKAEILLASRKLEFKAKTIKTTFERLAQTPLPAIACAVGLLGIMLFETVLSGLRTYVFAHTASSIDVEPGSRLFRHLVTLPLAYFQARRVGDSVARVRELEHIRSFLTGNAITLVLDILFSVVFSAVMFFYSGWLVVVSLPLYELVSLRVGYVW